MLSTSVRPSNPQLMTYLRICPPPMLTSNDVYSGRKRLPSAMANTCPTVTTPPSSPSLARKIDLFVQIASMPTTADWGYCAQLFSCVDVGDGVLINFVQRAPLLS